MKPLPCPGRSWSSFYVSLFLFLILMLSAVPASAQATTKANRALAESLTQSLMELHAQYRAAAPAERSTLIVQMRARAAERQQLLSSLIQTSPGEVLRVAIPGHIAGTLPASIQRSVEQETDTQGQ